MSQNNYILAYFLGLDSTLKNWKLPLHDKTASVHVTARQYLKFQLFHLVTGYVAHKYIFQIFKVSVAGRDFFFLQLALNIMLFFVLSVWVFLKIAKTIYLFIFLWWLKYLWRLIYGLGTAKVDLLSSSVGEKLLQPKGLGSWLTRNSTRLPEKHK